MRQLQKSLPNWHTAIALMLGLGYVGPATAAIIITSNVTQVRVYDSDPGVVSNSLQSNQGNGTTTATLAAFSSSATRALTVIGDTALFSVTFSQTRPGDNPSFYPSDASGDFNIYFTPTVNVTYDASGSYTNSGGRGSIRSQLRSLGGAQPQLFFSSEIAVGPSTLAVGGLTGNAFASFSGSRTGTLVAGTPYFWSFQGFTTAPNNAADLGGTASGSGSLRLGAFQDPTGATVPEPATLTMWSLSVLGCVIGAYRRRKRG